MAKGPEGRGGPRRIMPWGDLPRVATEASAGVLLVDKPAGVTSHDVVGAVRRLAGTRKVGHAGTLDPAATGLLVVGIGRATKLLHYLTGRDKSYTTTIALGIGTVSEDAEGDVDAVDDPALLTAISEERIDAALAGLTGDIMQRPSAVSAIKVNGRRAHEMMRAGDEVELAERPVTVHEFRRVSPVRADHVTVASRESLPVLVFDANVSVSSGTYVRALARDLAAALGVHGHLRALRRYRIGSWRVEDAAGIAAVAELVRGGTPLPVLGIDEVCASLFPVIQVSDDEEALLRHGGFIEAREAAMPARVGAPWPAAAMRDGRAVALVEPRKGALKPSLLLAV